MTWFINVPVKPYQNSFLACMWLFLRITYSGIRIQYATCLIPISTPLPIYFWSRADKIYFLRTQWWNIDINKKGSKIFFLKKFGLPVLLSVVYDIHTTSNLSIKNTSLEKTSNSPFKKCMVPVLQDWPKWQRALKVWHKTFVGWWP